MNREARRGLKAQFGFATQKGRRPDNQDYVGACTGNAARGIAAVVADGVGGHKGGREAAETAVRSFLDAYYALPETLGVQRAASRALDAVNQWIHAQGHADPNLTGMSCTFSCLILSRRSGHILHVGDSRIYRLSGGRLDCLTTDHVAGRGELSHVLQRAVGFEASVKVDHSAIGLRQHDRFLLCSDGVHGSLSQARMRSLLDARGAPEDSAREIVEAALAAGSSDNATALVADILELPPADQDELSHVFEALPIPPLPEPGDVVDGFRLGEVISDGRYSRLFHAIALDAGRPLALKFPHPRVASENSYRLAFTREAWVAAQVRSPFIGEILELPPGRQTRLYSVMPFYEGLTLEQRLKRSPISLTEGVAIAVKMARAIDLLHRAGIIHRDIKPDNVILTEDGGLRLIDLGVARAPRIEDFPPADIPGTPSYMAPELFQGQPGAEASDLYALGVTLYRMFSGAYPYGEIEPFMTPRFGKYAALSRARPDLPVWLDAAIARAVAVDPQQRYGDVIEFAHELEQGAALGNPRMAPTRSFYQRNPLRFWQIAALVLALLLLTLLIRDFGGLGLRK